MMRIAFTMRLKPDALPEYKYHHDNLPPELAAEIERSGIRQITTFQRGLDLFLVSEVDDEEAWQRLWTSAAHQRWAETMRPLMQIRDDGIVETAELAEVFHYQAGGSSSPWAPSDEDVELAREPAAEIALVEPSGEAALSKPADVAETFEANGLDEQDFDETDDEMIESPGGPVFAEAPWQDSSAHTAGQSNGVTLVEAIVVAAIEDEAPSPAEPMTFESPAVPHTAKKAIRGQEAGREKNEDQADEEANHGQESAGKTRQENRRQEGHGEKGIDQENLAREKEAG